MSRSSLITVATFSSIAASAVISVVWLVTATGTSKFHPAVEILGLLVGLTGVLGERRASARERRHLTLIALTDELQRVASILDNPRFNQNAETPRPRVYPRLPVSATDAALTSGALTQRGDDDLLRLLHNWRDEINGFNRRLDLTEIRVFTLGALAEITEFERVLHRNDGYLAQIRRHLQELQDVLDDMIPDSQGRLINVTIGKVVASLRLRTGMSRPRQV